MIAGIIGYHKPQFSLIGDTVNTSSRVCSTGLEGEITLSEEAYAEICSTDLDEEFKFKSREVEAKGKGKMRTYICERKKDKEISFSSNLIHLI